MGIVKLLVEGVKFLLFAVHVSTHFYAIMLVILQYFLLLCFIPDSLQTSGQISLHFITESVLAFAIVLVHHRQVAVEGFINFNLIFSPARVDNASTIELLCHIEGIFTDDLSMD